MTILFFGLGLWVKCISDNGFQTKLMRNKLDYMLSKRCLSWIFISWKPLRIWYETQK